MLEKGNPWYHIQTFFPSTWKKSRPAVKESQDVFSNVKCVLSNFIRSIFKVKTKENHIQFSFMFTLLRKTSKEENIKNSMN